MRRVLAILLLVSAFAPAPAAGDTYPDLSEWNLRDVVGIPDGFPVEGLRPKRAFEQQARDIWDMGAGTFERILRDDSKRPRHQRFVLRIDRGLTILVAHNIDLAPRVPLRKGDTVAFRGEYVWNKQGGVVHWTHRDRRDKKAGGWIVWKGQNFR
jgi:hypothetical protein